MTEDAFECAPQPKNYTPP